MITSHLSDKDLVTKILSGHPDLFGPLVERHIRAAHAIAYARLGNTADAEDAVQEAFLRAYERLATLRDPAKFAAWLLTITRHEAARIATKRRRAPLPSPDAEADPEYYPVEETLTHPDPAQHEMNAILRDHVMRLPEPAREVLLLHYFAGHSARDIAALLDLRRAAVLKRLQRAREQLAETLLRDLRETRPTSESYAKQATRIAALASALGIKHAASATPIAAATVATALLWKSLVAAFLVVGAVSITIVTRAVNVAGDPSPVPKATPVSYASTPTRAAAQAQEAFTVTRNPTSPSDPVTPQLETIAVDVDATNSEDGTLLIDGPWVVTGLPEIFEREVTIVELKPHGNSVVVSGKSGNFTLQGDGSLVGRVLRLVIVAKAANSRIDGPHLSLEGALGAHGDSLSLSGKLTDMGNAVFETPNGPMSIKLGPIPIQTIWKRLEMKNSGFRTFLAQKIREMEQLGHALGKYYDEHHKTLPVNLHDLVPTYLDSFVRYSREGGVDLQYDPSNHSSLEFTALSVQIKDVYHGDYRPDLAMPDRLMAYERDLQTFWADPLPYRAIVTATYCAHPLRLYLKQNGQVAASLTNHASHSLQAERFLAEQRASCANNLKQLGLSVRMFMDECPGEYSPPGWLSTYPEYAPDRIVFTCPNHEPGNFSYKLVWPTANAEELRQLYRDRVDASASDSMASARFPLIIETHECSGSGGRNILFLDGHVSYVKGPLEHNPDFAPFLNLR